MTEWHNRRKTLSTSGLGTIRRLQNKEHMWSPDAEKVVDQIASPWSPEEAEIWYHPDFSTRKLFGPTNFTAMMITGYDNNRKPHQLYFVGVGGACEHVSFISSFSTMLFEAETLPVKPVFSGETEIIE